MNTKIVIMGVLGSLLVFAFGGFAFAQESNSNLSIGEMTKQADRLIAEMRLIKDNSEASLRQSRDVQDIERMNCINEALLALKGVLNLAENYYYDLQAKINGDDPGGVKTDYTRLKIVSSKILELDSQIRSCGGPSDQGVSDGEPLISWNNDPDLPNSDPVEDLGFGEVFLERPSVASPYH